MLDTEVITTRTTLKAIRKSALNKLCAGLAGKKKPAEAGFFLRGQGLT